MINDVLIFCQQIEFCHIKCLIHNEITRKIIIVYIINLLGNNKIKIKEFIKLYLLLRADP